MSTQFDTECWPPTPIEDGHAQTESNPEDDNQDAERSGIS